MWRSNWTGDLDVTAEAIGLVAGPVEARQHDLQGTFSQCYMGAAPSAGMGGAFAAEWQVADEA